MSFYVHIPTPKVKTYYMTCSACPSQWEGTLEGGGHLYIRYRWGGISLYVGKDLQDCFEQGPIFTNDFADSLDGVMDDETMKFATGHILDWSEAERIPVPEEE